ncbi:MAG: peptidase associated/transthyretin-like domain-containing protein [Planctomycetota bacterium]|jgi:hypothetical protein
MAIRLYLISFLALAVACGGGADGLSGDTSLQTAALEGYVFEVDGQTVDREGVVVRIIETGAVTTTDAEGRFSFERVPADGVTLKFRTSLRALAHMEGGGQHHEGSESEGAQHQEGSESEGEQHQEHEHGTEHDECEGDLDCDDDEDHEDNPHMHGLVAGDRVNVRCSIEDDEVREFFMSGLDRLRAMAPLLRDEDSPGADVKGKVKIESRDDREKFEIEVEHLDAGDSVNLYMAPPPAEGEDPEFVFIANMTANTEGEAEFERDTSDGDRLPFDKESVADLSGYLIEVRLDDTDESLLLTGVVPELPESAGSWNEPGDGMQEQVRARARVRLTAHAAGSEGHAEIRRREENRQCLEIEAEHLQPGMQIGFFLETAADTGNYARIGSCQIDLDGACEIEFENALPFGISDVAELVGRQVQVRAMNGDVPGELLLAGTIPPLVAD